jgi:tripartite-type tricarboxylate transporter receptor subunit TctC
LAISRIQRSSLYPDLPTMDEAGVKGFNLDAWAGLVAPAVTLEAVTSWGSSSYATSMTTGRRMAQQ